MIKKPDISIVILTKNAGDQFRSTLTQIYNQKIDCKFEVIIVDSGSTDGTIQIANEFPVKRFDIQPSHFNFGLTRNYGFSLSSGEYIVTISQDAVPCNTKWLRNLITPFSCKNDTVAVQGVTKIPEEKDVFYWEKNGLFYFTSEMEKWGNSDKGGLSFVNCAVKKEFWSNHQIGYTPFSEDKYFQRLIHKAGKKIVVAKDAIVFHGHQYTYCSLTKRLLGEGVGWKYAGLKYELKDCLVDIVKNKWMIKQSYLGWKNREIKSFPELIFPLLRPICIFLGNKKGL